MVGASPETRGTTLLPLLVAAGFAVASGLASGCGQAVDPREVCLPGATVCWRTDGAPSLKVNDAPIEAKALPEEAHGFRLTTQTGFDYTISIQVSTVRVRFYVAPGEGVDAGINTIANGRSGGEFTFRATGPLYSLIVQDQGGPTGSEYAVRAYSYDEPSEPLPGTTHLEVNGAGVSRKLLKNGLARFAFWVQLGRDYEVAVDTTNGSIVTYMSTISSVDQDVHEWVASFGTIRFRASRAGWIYMAVVDHGGDTGSDFAVAVAET